MLAMMSNGTINAGGLLDERYGYPVTSNSVDVFSLSHVSECLSSLSETRDVHKTWDV